MPDPSVPPPAPVPEGPGGPLAGLSREDLRALLASLGEPRYRAEQVFRAVWREGILDPRAMTTLPGALRERLAATLPPPATTVLEVEESRDGTTKWLLGLADGKRIETVLIPEGERRTVCVSTQVGCPIRCVFCASGVEGLVRNLTVAEIAEQPLRVRERLGARPSHVVVMGMGEPLLNLQSLGPAIRIWEDEEGFGFSPRRITVSTASTPVLVERLRESGLRVNLAVSLHGPDDATRRALIPTSPEGRTQELIDAAARYAKETGRDATVEYVLIAGENDSVRHAATLARLLAGRHVHVNLIPLNPVEHRPDLRAPSLADQDAFVAALRAGGASATLRTRRGDDIAAACGQLAARRTDGARARTHQ